MRDARWEERCTNTSHVYHWCITDASPVHRLVHRLVYSVYEFNIQMCIYCLCAIEYQISKLKIIIANYHFYNIFSIQERYFMGRTNNEHRDATSR